MFLLNNGAKNRHYLRYYSVKLLCLESDAHFEAVTCPGLTPNKNSTTTWKSWKLPYQLDWRRLLDSSCSVNDFKVVVYVNMHAAIASFLGGGSCWYNNLLLFCWKASGISFNSKLSFADFFSSFACKILLFKNAAHLARTLFRQNFNGCSLHSRGVNVRSIEIFHIVATVAHAPLWPAFKSVRWHSTLQ